MAFQMKYGYGGFWNGSSSSIPPIVAGDYIWYSYDPITGYRVNADDGNVVIDQDTISPNFDGKVSASNAVALPDDAYIDLDIVHSLGADTLQLAALGDDWTGVNPYTATVATSALSNLSDNATDNVQINFTISNWTEGDVEGYGADGTYAVDVTDDSLNATSFSGDVLINSVKEITTDNSYFTYTDPVTQDIVGVTLPTATTYKMENDFSNAVSHDAPFSQEDLDLMKTDPLTLMKVWFDGLVLPSGFAKVNMKHYYVGNEGVNGGKYVQDITIPVGDNAINQSCIPYDFGMLGGNTIEEDGDLFKLIYVDSANICQTNIISSGTYSIGLLPELEYDVEYIFRFRAKTTGGNIRYQIYAGLGNVYIDINNDELKWYEIRFVTIDTYPTPYMRITNGAAGEVAYIEPGTMTLTKAPTASEIQDYTDACRTTYKNQRFGINNTRLMQDASGRATVVVDTHVARFNGTGSYIDSGIAVDGTLTDFTFMVAFTLPETPDVSQYLANTSGTNRLYVHHESGQPPEDLRIGIGQNGFDMPPVDTNLKIHAMVAVYDHTTQEVMGAVDGEPMASFGTIVFDGPTGKLIFGAKDATGADSFTGFIGEGIATASKLDETQWQEFWLRVKDIVPPQPMPTVTLSPVDKVVVTEGDPVLLRSNGTDYDTILWTYWDGANWTDIGGTNGFPDYQLPVTTGLMGIQMRAEYTNTTGTTVSGVATITAQVEPREWYNLGGDTDLCRIDIPNLPFSTGDKITFKFIAPTVTPTQTTRLLGSASGSSQLHHVDIYTVTRGTMKMDGVDVPTGSLVPTDGLIHEIEFTSNVEGDSIRYIGGNPTHGGSAEYQIFDILAETSNDWRFYPIADGWDNNPTLVETLIGANATLVNGLESNWDDFVVRHNDEIVTHDDDTVMYREN